jgi:hypothetical protein
VRCMNQQTQAGGEVWKCTFQDRKDRAHDGHTCEFRPARPRAF